MSEEMKADISTDEVYQLRRLKILQELQNELYDWGKRRFWWVVSVGTLVGVIGLNGIVLTALFTILGSRIEDITVNSGSARDAASRAIKASDEINKASEELANMIKDLQRQLQYAKNSHYEMKIYVKGPDTGEPGKVSSSIRIGLRAIGFKAELFPVLVSERVELSGGEGSSKHEGGNLSEPRGKWTVKVEKNHKLEPESLKSHPALISSVGIDSDIVNRVHKVLEEILGPGKVERLNSRNEDMWSQIDIYIPENLETNPQG